MSKKFILISIAAMLLLPFSLYTQDDKTIQTKYVDIGNAKLKIEKLEKANAEYNEKIKDLETHNNQLNDEISKFDKRLTEINDLIEKFRKNGLLIYEKLMYMIDSVGQEKALNTYEENKKTLTKLYGKKIELENNITNRKQTIAANNYDISSLKNRIRINDEEIVSLEEAIENTNSRINEIDGDADATSKLIKEAEQLLE